MTPETLAALEASAAALVAELIRNPSAAGEVVEIDLAAGKTEIERLLTRHADALAGLSVGAAFDLLAARVADRFEPGSLDKTLRLLSDEALAAEAEAVADLAEGAVASQEARIAMLREFAQVSMLVFRGVLGAVIAAQLGDLSGRA